VKPFRVPLSVTAVALFALGCAPSPGGHVRSDTLSYIEAVSEQGMSVARTMAGASNLEDIRGVLLTAKSVEASRYGDYLRAGNGEGPSNAQDIADDADEVHRLFQQAVSEFLMYWEDRNAAHVTDGSAMLKRCVSQANIIVNRMSAQR